MENQNARQVDLMYKLKEDNTSLIDTVLIFKTGQFYSAYDTDAEIIAFLNKYKIINKKGYQTCGFPLKSLNKVIDKLDIEEINYKIYENIKTNKKAEKEKNFKINNRYQRVSNKASKNNEKQEKVQKIKTTLDNIIELPYAKKIIEELEKELQNIISKNRRKYEEEN